MREAVPIFPAMNLSGEMLQFLGSLAAILLLAGLARAFGLGGNPGISNPEQARIAAGEAVYGFVPEACAIDRGGKGAILEDASGRLLLLKRHGSKYAGRLLGPQAIASIDGDRLIVRTGERRYGDVSLAIADAVRWARRIDALKDMARA